MFTPSKQHQNLKSHGFIWLCEFSAWDYLQKGQGTNDGSFAEVSPRFAIQLLHCCMPFFNWSFTSRIQFNDEMIHSNLNQKLVLHVTYHLWKLAAEILCKKKEDETIKIMVSTTNVNWVAWGQCIFPNFSWARQRLPNSPPKKTHCVQK